MHPNIRTFIWFNFFTDFKPYAPIAILYFTQVSGSFVLGMSVFSIIQLSSALFEIPTGVFSDRIGRKKTIVLGAIAAFVSAIFYAVGGAYPFLAIGAIAEGISRAFYSGNNDAFLHDTLSLADKQDEFAQVLGKLSSMFQIALATSAILGSVLAAVSLQAVMWVSVVPQFICVLIALYFVDVPKREVIESNVFAHLKEAFRLFIKNPKLRDLSISHILAYAFSESTYVFQSAFYQTVWPVWAIGIPKLISNVGAMLGFRIAGKLIGRFNNFQLLFWGNLYRRGMTLFSVIFPSVFSPILMSSTSIPWAINSTGLDAMLQKEFSSEKRATMASLNSFGGSLLFALFALGLGRAADAVSPAAAIIGISCLSFIQLFLYKRMFHRYS